MSTLSSRLWTVLGACLWLFACAGSGPYNFARSYQPLRAEKIHLQAAQAVPYEDVKRDPNGFQNQEVAWFGVVKGMGDLPDGRTRVSLSLHAHHERHLCSERAESSCRLTIAERELGPFSAEITLSPEEKQGTDRVWVGSLLKIYGFPTGAYDDDGGPVIRASYHRHWPRGTYVTTASRANMRR